jgi:hypothetical protein
MSETRKVAAILVADAVGYSRLAGADEDRTLARLRTLRSDLVDPTIAVHHGRVVKRMATVGSLSFAASSTPSAARSKCRARDRRIARTTHRVPRRASCGRPSQSLSFRRQGRQRDAGRNIWIASDISSAFPLAVSPFGRWRPSSNPTRVDQRCWYARLTKCQTVASIPCRRMGRLTFACSRACTIPSAVASAFSRFCSSISMRIRKTRRQSGSATSRPTSATVVSPASTPTPILCSKAMMAGASRSERLTEA